MERTKLSGREYGALQTLFALVSAWETALPTLSERLRAVGMEQDGETVQRLSEAILDSILRTVPETKLRHIREELAHVSIYIRIEAPGIKTIHGSNYSYLPTNTLNDLLNHLIGQECVMCDKSADEAKKCQWRELIEDSLPHSVGRDHGDHCMYSDMIIGLGVNDE